MITVLVANPKGGCGKTTIATNLAAAFANGGLRAALADADRQRDGLHWLKLRPDAVPRILGLDWVKGDRKSPKNVDRLVVDCPAGLRPWRFREFAARADVVVVPVLPSPFDERTTERFMKRILKNKAIRKRRVAVGLVRNRTRARSRAADRLEAAMARMDAPGVGEIRDRALYVDLAANGLGVFDLPTPRIETVQADWRPLLRYVETAGWEAAGRRGRTG